MTLHKVNLNLLPVLRELLARRSVSAAASALGRSPSAVSQALTQLRAMLGDPLLVRTRNGLALTSRGEALIEPVEQAYQQMSGVLQEGGFDPATAERSFVIAATDYDIFAHGPAILAAVERAARGIHLRFVDVGRDLQDRIDTRRVDFALMPSFLIGELTSDRLDHGVLATSTTVALMRADHPLAACARVGLADLGGYPHVSLYPSWEVLERRSALTVNRQALRSAVHLPHAVTLPFFLIDARHVALAPDRVAERIGEPLGLIHRSLDFDEAPVDSVLAWSPVQQADPAHRWLRDLLLTLSTNSV